MSPKIIPWAIESLSIPSDWTRPVVLEAYSWMICRRNSFYEEHHSCYLFLNNLLGYYRSNSWIIRKKLVSSIVMFLL
jgi:hypothetical protein